MSLDRAAKFLIEHVNAHTGIELSVRRRRRPRPVPSASERHLNVGSGGERIPGFENLDYPSEWYRARQVAFTPYDMRAEPLPADDGTIDTIYCSHVIEHIETPHVERFFAEAARALKPGGVLRIACPDAEFLWHVSTFENQYWDWRHRWFTGPLSIGCDPAELRQSDFLIREIATARSA